MRGTLHVEEAQCMWGTLYVKSMQCMRAGHNVCVGRHNVCECGTMYVTLGHTVCGLGTMYVVMAQCM